MNLVRLLEGFPCSSVGKESACNSGYPGLIPSAWEGNGNPLQYSCLENPMDRGIWWATVNEGTRVGHDLATNLSRLLDSKLMWKIQWSFSASATDKKLDIFTRFWEILLGDPPPGVFHMPACFVRYVKNSWSWQLLHDSDHKVVLASRVFEGWNSVFLWDKE